MKRALFFIWNLYPPFFGAGIVIQSISKDFTKIRVKLKKRPWTSNIVGTQFGGSIYMMTDPFYMALLMEHLGQEYVVWDKSSQIRFRKPGRKDLFADFEINPEDLVNIKSRLESESKLNWEREVFVKDKDGTVIAEVNKVIYIARKNELPKIRNGK